MCTARCSLQVTAAAIIDCKIDNGMIIGISPSHSRPTSQALLKYNNKITKTQVPNAIPNDAFVHSRQPLKAKAHHHQRKGSLRALLDLLRRALDLALGLAGRALGLARELARLALRLAADFLCGALGLAAELGGRAGGFAVLDVASGFLDFAGDGFWGKHISIL
jgi:hypothetical protein